MPTKSGGRPRAKPARRAMWPTLVVATSVLTSMAASGESTPANASAEASVIWVAGAGAVAASVPAGEAWSPVGDEVVLEEYQRHTTDRLLGGGVAVSGDGSRVAVSFTPSRDVFDPSCSAFETRDIQVREWDGRTWALLGAEITTAWGDRLGLSGDGNRLVVGAPVLSSPPLDCGSGKVYVYDLQDGSWALTATITPDGNPDSTSFGSSVAVSADGRVVAVGAPAYSGPSLVSVFAQGAVGAGWTQLGDDLASSESGTRFGARVALTTAGTRLAVGAPGFGRTFAGEEGLARVFDWSGSSWNQVGDDVVGLVRRDRFGGGDQLGGGGVDISTDGDRIAVSRERSGSIVMEWAGGEWRQVGGVAGWRLSADGTRTLRDDRLVEWDTSGWVPVAGPVEDVVAFSDRGDRVVSIRQSPDQWCVFELAPTMSPGEQSPARCRFSDLQPLTPARLMETRVGAGDATVDGLSAGIGRRAAGSVTGVRVTGRGGVSLDATAVVLNVTAVAPSGSGHVTVYPCGEERPVASTLNYLAGQVVANAAFAKIGVGGTVCMYSHASTDFVVDVSAFVPVERGAVAATTPRRLLDTRDAEVDSTYPQRMPIGRRPAGSTTELCCFASEYSTAVWLTVTAVAPSAPGHVTVYPCSDERPLASNLNYAAGDVIANSVFTRIDHFGEGPVCIYTHAATDLVVDFAGAAVDVTGVRGLRPARVLESRVADGYTTVDGLSAGIDRRQAGSVTRVQVTGRGFVPQGSSAVMLNVTAVAPDGPGHLTVYPCAEPRPLASNLNYVDGEVIAGAVLTKVGGDGMVCIYTHAAIDLVADVSGYVW